MGFKGGLWHPGHVTLALLLTPSCCLSPCSQPGSCTVDHWQGKPRLDPPWWTAGGSGRSQAAPSCGGSAGVTSWALLAHRWVAPKDRAVVGNWAVDRDQAHAVPSCLMRSLQFPLLSQPSGLRTFPGCPGAGNRATPIGLGLRGPARHSPNGNTSPYPSLLLWEENAQ